MSKLVIPPLPPPTPPTPKTLYCSVCSKPSLLRCSRCLSIQYCSQSCQKQNWSLHKLSCNKLQIDRLNNEEKKKIQVAIINYDYCIANETSVTLTLNQFQMKYSREIIDNDYTLRLEEKALITSLIKAWKCRLAAYRAANLPTIEKVFWIMAKNGFTSEVAPLINLTLKTRNCNDLQEVMMEVKNRWGMTQLRYFCRKGMTASVVRMLAMRSIDIEAKNGVNGWTCLYSAACFGHLDICRMLLDKGAQVNARSKGGWTPLHYAAQQGHIEIVRLLCDRGADIEARDNYGTRPLHVAAIGGHLSIVKYLIE